MPSFNRIHLKLTSPEQFSTLDSKSHDFVWDDLWPMLCMGPRAILTLRCLITRCILVIILEKNRTMHRSNRLIWYSFPYLIMERSKEYAIPRETPIQLRCKNLSTVMRPFWHMYLTFSKPILRSNVNIPCKNSSDTKLWFWLRMQHSVSL